MTHDLVQEAIDLTELSEFPESRGRAWLILNGHKDTEVRFYGITLFSEMEVMAFTSPRDRREYGYDCELSTSAYSYSVKREQVFARYQLLSSIRIKKALSELSDEDRRVIYDKWDREIIGVNSHSYQTALWHLREILFPELRSFCQRCDERIARIPDFNKGGTPRPRTFCSRKCYNATRCGE